MISKCPKILQKISIFRHYSSLPEVRVRFAPSPTGRLHLGGLRTALYNYVFAKSKGGKFILRIEDTDQARLKEGAAEEFEELLSFYGLETDESPIKGGPKGPYRQSERLELYHDAVERLVEEGKAYRCFCSEKRLEIVRKNALSNRTIPRYDNHCRQISKEESKSRKDEPHVVRFKFDKDKVDFTDIAYGQINALADEGDFIVLKSDKFPTYHLANIVDDHLMGISHVIRGQEWLPSVPKHVKLYEAFDWPTPSWLHLPLIMKNARKKLSKRDEDGYADYYHSQKGYLRSAVLNLLIRNGAGIRDFDFKRFYELEDIVENFDENLLGTRNLQLDDDVLERYGRLSVQHAYKKGTLKSEIRNFFKMKNVKVDPEMLSDEKLDKSLDFLMHNEEAFSHMAQLVRADENKEKDKFSFLFTRPQTAVELPTGVKSKEMAVKFIKLFLDHIESENGYNYEKIKVLCKENEVPVKKLLLLIRISIIENPNGPPISELFQFFGQNEVRNRLEQQIKWLEEKEISEEG
ncbi:unnamed protein product [Bursaphelenchus xylophilus]|uniref:Nondiscriminating glutamyl-tRNA synthetase EARS2, mitochondrial n=1 Tax=Bursaphelenchus xylophilus TaxID=6326 RepID=A0A1I7S9U2_BURXY|nr:unnamed protein product [Bursaphelenchus xylophilus]CAG9129243.1 unnamed protein product [Bursaphelenchus xylophilus]